jgi:hypothetical protein
MGRVFITKSTSLSRGENDPVTISQEVGWGYEPVWTDSENITPTGIPPPDSPARSESLYQLSYTGCFELRRKKPVKQSHYSP